MLERNIERHIEEQKYPILSEIKRPFLEEITLFDYKDALVVDDKFILAYKKYESYVIPGHGPGDKLMVARERTIPIKIENTKREFIYPYPNEDELRGLYGVLIIDVNLNKRSFYVGEKYKITFDGSFSENGKWCADVSIKSINNISADFIDGKCDYNHYLRLLNASK